MPVRIALFALMALVMTLAACGQDAETVVKKDAVDPAIGAALADQIMVDPDLAGQNRGNAALTGGGPADGSLPPEISTPEAIAAAKADAVKLVGGTLRAAPAPGGSAHVSPAAVSLTAAETAQVLGKTCADKVDYTVAWAARMPAAFPAYPRGHVREAAGTDKDGCSLRVVNFVTPVAVQDVLDFYFTRAASAGLPADRRREGGDEVLKGNKGQAAYIVYVRQRVGGMTEVDLVVSGG